MHADNTKHSSVIKKEANDLNNGMLTGEGLQMFCTRKGSAEVGKIITIVKFMAQAGSEGL